MTITPTTTMLLIVQHITADLRSGVVEPNDWNGYDIYLNPGRMLRLTQEDPEGGITLYAMDRNAVVLAEASFSATITPNAIAYVAQTLR